jgi:hypothetical protein
MMLPDGTVELDCCVVVPTTSDALVIAVVAAARVSPVTFGTATGAGPLETTRFTDEPTEADVAPFGVWLITLPTGTEELDCCVTVPTSNDPFVIAVAAAACVMPVTVGTEVDAPLAMTRFTAEPTATCVGVTGVWLMTRPAATDEPDCCVTVPTTNEAPVIAAAAAWNGRFRTFGTAGPLDTTRLTDELAAAAVPAAGVWPMTVPAVTVTLGCSVIEPTTSAASRIALLAGDSGTPTTFGTVIGAGGPAEITR